MNNRRSYGNSIKDIAELGPKRVQCQNVSNKYKSKCQPNLILVFRLVPSLFISIAT